MAFFDLLTLALRSALQPGPKPIGIAHPQSSQRTLGRATLLGPGGDGIGFFGFKTALKKAEAFRRRQHEIGAAASSFNLWHRGQMTICPVGDIITVGHALHRFIEWRRISAAHSTFSSNRSQVNHHLVPRIATIPLADFNGEHFHRLCRDVLETPPKKEADGKVPNERLVNSPTRSCASAKKRSIR